MAELTHIDSTGAARMVDVGKKDETQRVAVAEGFVAMAPETLALIVEGKAAKGDVLATARIAGIMGSKRTADLIPLCHPLNITRSAVELTPVFAGGRECGECGSDGAGGGTSASGHRYERSDGRAGIHVLATLGVTGKTGIEMEALTACSVACLTIYDMCKAVDRGMEIGEIRLLRKEGGKSGLWTRPIEGSSEGTV
jgi:cyclic pyranopterin phosphate synthase